MKAGLVPGRLPGAVLATAGGLLALPTVFWPVVVIEYNPPDDTTYSQPPYGQGVWSWGKYAEVGNPDTNLAQGMGNTPGLVFLAASLVIGLAAAVAWALVAGSTGRALGLAGACFLAATQLGSLAQWGGQLLNGLYGGPDSSIRVLPQTTAWLQFVSGGLLVLAVGFMAWRPVWALLSPIVLRLRGSFAGRRAGAEAASMADLEPTTPQVGTAVLQERDGTSGRGRRDDGPSVGFSDEARETGRRSRRSR